MLSLIRSRPKSNPKTDPAPAVPTPEAADGSSLIGWLSQHASTMGREAAEVRGAIDDTTKVATAQAQALHALLARHREWLA